MATGCRLGSVCDSCLTRTNHQMIASGAGCDRQQGWLRWRAEQQPAAAPLPLLGALSAPAVRVGLPSSHVGAQSDACRTACWTGIRTVPISDSAWTPADGHPPRPMPPRHDNSRQPTASMLCSVTVWPLLVSGNGETGAPARAHPAAHHWGLRLIGCRLLGDDPHQRCHGAGLYAQSTGDLLGGPSRSAQLPHPDEEIVIEQLVQRHA